MNLVMLTRFKLPGALIWEGRLPASAELCGPICFVARGYGIHFTQYTCTFLLATLELRLSSLKGSYGLPTSLAWSSFGTDTAQST